MNHDNLKSLNMVLNLRILINLICYGYLFFFKHFWLGFVFSRIKLLLFICKLINVGVWLFAKLIAKHFLLKVITVFFEICCYLKFF